GGALARAARAAGERGGLPRAAPRAVAAVPGGDAGDPHWAREGALERHHVPLQAEQRLLLPDRRRGAGRRAGALARRRWPPRRALRGAERRPLGRDLLYEPGEGGAVGGPPAWSAGEPGLFGYAGVPRPAGARAAL